MATRILIHSHAFAPKVGGLETVVMSLAMGLASMGKTDDFERADVTVVTTTPRGDFEDESLPFRLVRQPSVSQLLRSIWAADVIHLAGPCFLPMLIGLLLRKPVVVEHHGFQAICPNGQLFHEPTQTPCPGHFMAKRYGECVRCNANIGLFRSLMLWFITFPRRWQCKLATSNITPTKWLAELLQLPRSTTVYHGLSGNRNKVSQFSSQPWTFAFVGRLVSTKGVQTLLQAAQQLRVEGFHYRLKVIGDGPDREALQQQVVTLGLGDFVQFLGYVSPECLEKHLAEVATVVMPSLAGEVFGMVAAENMSRGKLVIGSDLGAIREVIGDTGLWFAPGDVAGLTQSMKMVLKDPLLPVGLGRKAQQRAFEQFDEKQMLLLHLGIYRKVLTCAMWGLLALRSFWLVS